MSGKFPILSRRQPPCTVAVFYERRDRRFRIEVWHDSGVKAMAWVPATYEPVLGVDFSDMEDIEEKVAEIIRDFETAQGGTA